MNTRCVCAALCCALLASCPSMAYEAYPPPDLADGPYQPFVRPAYLTPQPVYIVEKP